MKSRIFVVVLAVSSVSYAVQLSLPSPSPDISPVVPLLTFSLHLRFGLRFLSLPHQYPPPPNSINLPVIYLDVNDDNSIMRDPEVFYKHKQISFPGTDSNAASTTALDCCPMPTECPTTTTTTTLLANQEKCFFFL